MKPIRYCLAGFAAFALSVNSRVGAGAEASQMENEEVLQKLQDYDSIFASGFTVSCLQQGTDQVIRGRLQLGVKRRWRFTFDGGDRVGYLMEAVDYEKPKYELLDEELPGQKARLVPVRTRQWGYWGPDLSGNHYEDTVLAVTSTGEVTDTGKMYNSSVFGPRDEGPAAPRRVLLWSLGRFFAKHLDKVTRVEQSTDGRLVVSALGRMSDRDKGRWEFEIEPAAAWMVRKARFYWDRNPNRSSADMKNDGTVWNGPYCIPKEAVCNYWGPIGNVETQRLTYEPVVEKFDEKLYTEAQHVVAHNKRPTLTIHDFRVSPPVISQPFKPQPDPTPPTPASPARKWFFVGNLVVLMALIVFLILWKRPRNSTQGSP